MNLFFRGLIIVVIISLLVLLFVTLAGCRSISTTSPAATEKSVQSLIDTITSEMRKKKITGLSIVVTDSSTVLWAEGFGLADKKAKREFSSDTISNVGSVSKLVTSAAIMRLVELGMVDLDQPVETYIPEFEPKGTKTYTTPITVRMLLNHQSGLDSDAFRGFYLGTERPEDFPYTYRRAIDAVNDSGIVRDPYEVFSYCNLGYSLLGVIIERAVGKSFQQSVKELVFDPLAMNDSTFELDTIPSDRRAMGYLSGKPSPLPYIRDMPAGSLNSTAIDMGRFLQSILASYTSDEGLLSNQTVRDMFTQSNEHVAADLDFKVGLSWWIVDLKELNGEFVVGHGGDLPPYHALVIMLPERDLSVFVMVNSVDGVGSFSLTEIITEAVRTFLEEEEETTIPNEAAESPVVQMPPSLREELIGYYASPVGLSEVKVSNGRLKVFTFNRWFDAYYHEDGSLTLGYKLLGLFPLKMPVFDELSISLEPIAGSPAINLRIQDILISPALKIAPGPIDPAWLSRTGSYVSTSQEVMPHYTDFRIEMDEHSGFLCLGLKSEGEWAKYPLETLDEHTARLLGTGRSLGSLLTVNEDSSVRYQNFKLVRK